jgi:hypothetical protein
MLDSPTDAALPAPTYRVGARARHGIGTGSCSSAGSWAGSWASCCRPTGRLVGYLLSSYRPVPARAGPTRLVLLVLLLVSPGTGSCPTRARVGRLVRVPARARRAGLPAGSSCSCCPTGSCLPRARLWPTGRLVLVPARRRASCSCLRARARRPAGSCSCRQHRPVLADPSTQTRLYRHGATTQTDSTVQTCPQLSNYRQSCPLLSIVVQSCPLLSMSVHLCPSCDMPMQG